MREKAAGRVRTMRMRERVKKDDGKERKKFCSQGKKKKSSKSKD